MKNVAFISDAFACFTMNGMFEMPPVATVVSNSRRVVR